MNFLRLERQVITDEGFRNLPYLDTVGVWTIGFGSIMWEGNPVTQNTPKIKKKAAVFQLRADLFEACIIAQELFPAFDKLNHVRQEVLVNMAYNLGETRLSKFVRMRLAIEDLDYPQWAVEMVNSKWWKQVGNRAVRLHQAVLTGVWA